MELELYLLMFANCMIDNDYDGALAQAQNIAKMNISQREDIIRVREALTSLISENYQSTLSNDQISNIVNALNIQNMQAFLALILFNKERATGMDATKFKNTMAYQYLNQDSPQFMDDVEKEQFVSALAMSAIATRDKELIDFMLAKVQALQ